MTRQPFWIVGAPIPGVPTNAPEPAAGTEPFTAADLRSAARSVTLTLVIGGIVAAFVAGAGFALGSGLVARHVLKEKR